MTDGFLGILPDWQTIKDFIVSFGWVKGMFALFFWFSQGWIYILYRGRLSDRQKEIDRIAKDNREYRERFLSILDDKFGYKQLQGKPKPKK